MGRPAVAALMEFRVPSGLHTRDARPFGPTRGMAGQRLERLPEGRLTDEEVAHDRGVKAAVPALRRPGASTEYLVGRPLRWSVRVACVTRSFLPGLELAELFHADVMAPILEAALEQVPYSAARIGWGSEVQGYDTARSTDHAWGPRMQVFLARGGFRARAGDLDALLDRESGWAPPSPHFRARRE